MNTDLYWRRKLHAFLHDSPDKATDIPDHETRAGFLRALDSFEPVEFFDRSADWMASAADRIPFPHHSELVQPFEELSNFPHPLGGAALPVGAPFKSITEAFETSQKTRPFLLGDNHDARAAFIAAWRFWRNWASSVDSRFTHLPADTRIPDHSIWHHLAVTSAFEGVIDSAGATDTASGTDHSPRLLLFSIGPVQDFIAAARSTRDLWSGSYLLAWLASKVLGRIALDFGPDHVLFPNLIDQPLIDVALKEKVYDRFSFSDKPVHDGFGYKDENLGKLLTPSLPNRFLALLPARLPDGQSCEDYAAGLVKDLKDAFLEIIDSVLDHLKEPVARQDPDAPFITLDHERIRDQQERLLEVHWQSLPIPSTLEQLEHLLPLLSAPGKDAEAHAPCDSYHAIREMVATCPPQYQLNPAAAWGVLNSLVAWLHDGAKATRAFEGWNFGRWQSGTRFNKDQLTGREEAVLTVAAKPEQEAQLQEWCKEGLEMSKSTLKPGERLGLATLVKRFWWHTLLCKEKALGIPGDVIRREHPMPNTHAVARHQPWADSDDADEAADRSVGENYFAMLALDGDEMGKWISGAKAPRMRHCLAPEAEAYYQSKAPGFLDAPRSVTPSWHLQFSEALANFSFHAVRRIVEAFDGRLLYAGGDDVLAMLPADTALACARALRAAFRGDPTLNDLARGVVDKSPDRAKRRSDGETPLFDIKHEGYLQLHPGSDVGHGAEVGLLSDPVDFPALVPGPAADVSAGVAIAHFKAPLQDVVRAAQAAEKRAKNAYGRAACAVTIMKRSGEINEWGCKWEEQGIELAEAVRDQIARSRLSAKFPHRVIELLDPYLTREKVEPDAAFGQAVDAILKAEFATACQRQSMLKGKEREDQAEKLGDGLQHFLTASRKRLARAADKEKDAGKRKDLRRNLPDALVESVIGLMRTAAFERRIASSPATPTQAERHPTHA